MSLPPSCTESVIGGPEGVRGVMATGAGHLAGAGQRGIEEHLAAERLERGGAGIGLRAGQARFSSRRGRQCKRAAQAKSQQAASNDIQSMPARCGRSMTGF